MNRDLEPQQSNGEVTLDKIDKRDRSVRAIELVVLAILVGFNVFSAFSLQTLITANQKSAVIARKTNLAKQDSTQSYIKCIVLLRYDNPTLNQNSTKAETEKALDKCATITNN
jgi:hypothetical protein